MSSEAKGEIELAKRKLQSLEKQIGKLLDFVATGGVSENTARAKIKDLEQRERYVRKYLKELKEQHASESITEDMVLDAIMESKKLLKAKDKKYDVERQNFIRYYVKKVIVYEDEIKITFQNEPETQQKT
jgi:hypothetical protein